MNSTRSMTKSILHISPCINKCIDFFLGYFSSCLVGAYIKKTINGISVNKIYNYYNEYSSGK